MTHQPNSRKKNRKPISQMQSGITAKVIVVVHDQGGGFNMCGHCFQTIVNHPLICPHCGSKLKGSEVASPTGGSDF